jgi:GGDEF domain-containing protein
LRGRAADQAELLAQRNAAPTSCCSCADRTPLAVHQGSAPAGIRAPTAEQIASHMTGPPPPGVRISVTCSVGVAAYPVHGDSVDELLRRADAALYTAKSEGRDRVVNATDVAADVRPPTNSRVGAW